MKPIEYDGFYFLPGEEDDELSLKFFQFDGSLAEAKKVDSQSKIGDLWHIAFFTKDEEGLPVFDETFEAIFADPEVYVRNLCGTGLYGCVLRKSAPLPSRRQTRIHRARKAIDTARVRGATRAID